MNNFKKVTIALLLFIVCSPGAYTQTHEIGLRLSSLNDFDFIYKKKKGEMKYIRHRIGLASVAVGGQSGENNVNVSLAYAIGIENRREINENLMFIHGIEPRLTVNMVNNSSLTRWNIGPGIGYVLGFQYNFEDAFYINLETIPSVVGNFNLRNGSDDMYSVVAGFNSNAIALTLAYRFNSKSEG